MQSQVKSSSNRSFIALQENESKWQLIEKAQFIICQVLKRHIGFRCSSLVALQIYRKVLSKKN